MKKETKKENQKQSEWEKELDIYISTLEAEYSIENPLDRFVHLRPENWEKIKDFVEKAISQAKQEIRKETIEKISKWIIKDYGNGICCEDREILLRKLTTLAGEKNEQK